MTLEEFIAQQKITMDVEKSPVNPHMKDSETTMLNWYVTLRCGQESLTLFFSTGVGWVEDAKGNPVHNGYVVKLPERKIIPVKRHVTVYEMEQATAKYRIRKPSVSDVLTCLAEDAASIENSDGYDDWSEDLGGASRESYDITAQQTLGLKRLLGAAAYEFLMNEVETL